ncbi:MAG: hypothetical protein A3E84_00355 [Gammaproteobacteria bacterium RIFCSPHIGHO2_12_FULL_42_13]|nr:MAG: hypothetical protein A3E84_00355 [Gammaproteobacteria bacterium RIFCSPHIGHO2_12_FULL_42_13]
MRLLGCFTILLVFSNAIYAEITAANWMSRIPDHRIFNQLIIPGTHDSGTYAITSSAPYALSKDDPLPIWVEEIGNWLPSGMLGGVIAGWAKTQPYTILEQLNAGARYLDFRIDLFPGDHQFYLSHAMLGVAFESALQQVQTFVSTHPTEIVIVDMNHIFNVSDTGTQQRLETLITQYLGKYAIPNTYHPTDTIGTLREHGQVIIILSNTLPNTPAPIFWQENNSIDSPWPNASSVDELHNKLNDEMIIRKTAPHDKFFVLQMVQTETSSQVFDGIFYSSSPSTIERFEAPLNAVLNDWILQYMGQYGGGAVNIVLQDWFTTPSNILDIAMQYDYLT